MRRISSWLTFGSKFRGMLQEIPANASVHRTHEVFLVGIHAEDENTDSLAFSSNLRRRFEAVQSRHRDIHNHDVRVELFGERVLRQAASRFADAERALWFPSISAVAAAGLTPYRQTGLNSRYSAVGLNINIPLANGGLFSARGAEASLRARAEEQRLRDLENRVARDVRTAWLDAQASFLRLDLTEQLRSQASDAADLAQARYDIGLGSIVELSQAQLNKTRAELEQATARYDFQTRTAVLRFQIGALK